jgi:DNA-binding PadR family transcriptional regulator
MSSLDISTDGISRRDIYRGGLGDMCVDPNACLPLTEPTFYILLSLAPGGKHGYAILQDIEMLSKGSVSLSTSTLYSALGRLLDQSLIERVPDDLDDAKHPGRPRKAYILSELGRHVLRAETDRLSSLVETARPRLAVEGI